MSRETPNYVRVVAAFCMLVFLADIALAAADLQATRLSGNLSFAGNDVDFSGVLWAGDKNFGLWKSLDNGTTFQPVYRIPGNFDINNPYSGLVWTVYVDSRGFIFVSAGGTNALYRSTNGGASFSQVLNTNGSRSESFYISMTEDNLGNLYTATYSIGYSVPQLLKSTNGGATWTRIGNFNSVMHFHTIKYNPSSGYLYVATGERYQPLTNFNDSEKVFRSKDNGATWNLIVDRSDSLGTVYLAMAFVGDYVYLGQDFPNRVCQIHRFLDNGSNIPFIPQVVYTPPDSFMPFMSGAYFNRTLVFGNCAEAQNGVTRTVASTDGVNWNIITSASVTPLDCRWNMFTVHPRSDTIYATLTSGYLYKIFDGPPVPTPRPTPSPTTNPTPSQTPQPTLTPTPTLVPSPTPIPSPTPTPEPTATPTPTPIPTLIENSVTIPQSTPVPQTTSKSVANKPLVPSTPKPTISPTVNSTAEPNQTTRPSVTIPEVGTPTAPTLFDWLIMVSVMVGGSLLSVSVLRKRLTKQYNGDL
jgi:hypothetical protein